MSGAKDVITLLGPTGIVVVSIVTVFGLIFSIPSSDPPTSGYSDSCTAANPGSDDGQGAMQGIHPVASTALRRAGVTAGMISQGLGNAGQSSGTHNAIPGSPFGAAADIKVGGRSEAWITEMVHTLRMQGFVTWYREPGWNGGSGSAHIHANYAGLPAANNVAAGQVQTFLDSVNRRRNGLADGGGRNPQNFPLNTFPTPEEIESVRSVYQGGSGCVGGSSGVAEGGGPASGSAKAFIDWIGPLASNDDIKTGVPASVTIAQSILESGWGKSSLARKGKNLFGIKGKGPAGSVTTAKGVRFRAYYSYAEGIADHSRILAKPDGYYTKWWGLRNDPVAYIRGIAETYAPSSDGNVNYAIQVIGMIKRYDLTQYDR